MKQRGGALGAILGAIFGAVGDVVGKPLRGLVLAVMAAAAGVLAGLTWAVITYLVPLIPHAHGAWMGIKLDTVSAGAEVAAGFASVIVAIVLWPAVSMMVGGVFFEAAAERIEKIRFPADPPGRQIPLGEALGNAAKIALPALGIGIITAPLLFVPGLNLIVFVTVNAALMSREYFSIAALRFRPWADVKALRKRHSGAIFVGGLTCAALLLVPILNFLAPLYGAALMVRLNKALSAAQPGG